MLYALDGLQSYPTGYAAGMVLFLAGEPSAELVRHVSSKGSECLTMSAMLCSGEDHMTGIFASCGEL